MRILLQSLLCIVLCPLLTSAQQTVGIFKNSQAAFNGYTLFGPMSGNETYLINNCGELVHKWSSTYRPGVMSYLLENGTLLRPGIYDNPFFLTGGAGGIIQLLDWDGTVLWEYTVSTRNECQHHDIEPLPNGNILVLAWDAIPGPEAIQAGRGLVGESVWSEKVIEIEPDYVNGGGRVVWEWRLWDHIVQNHAPHADSYGDPSTSPRLMDLNYTPFNAGHPDWLHINSIDYNPVLDQIILSCNFINEVWIIDHSTTTEEARTHEGGRSGHGGDLLFRWGNPAAYRQGNKQDQRLSRQHDARWITTPGSDSGMIMVFNNMAGDLDTGTYSTVNVFDPGLLPDGNYAMHDGRFGPDDFVWTYKAPNPSDMYSSFISGADRLPNGNTLICEGDKGRFLEVTRDGEIVWEYVSPAIHGGAIPQGQAPAENMVFRIQRYSPEYSAFEGKNLSSSGYLEPGSTFTCDLFVVGVHERGEPLADNISIHPNPASHMTTLNAGMSVGTARIVDNVGRTAMTVQITAPQQTIDVGHLTEGVYYIITTTSAGATITSSLVLRR